MASTTPCVPCCTTPLNVDVPGIEGTAGTAGTNGQNAYTTTTANFAVPGSSGSNVTIAVASSLWMVAGQMVVVAGPATFRVSSVPTATSAILTWQAATGDVAAGTTITSGAGVSPAGVGVITTTSAYAAGTVYSLTNAAAKVAFGTTSPSIVLAASGTYLLLCNFRLDYNAATFTASRTVIMKLRRINNTAADLTNAAISLATSVVTTVTQTFDIGAVKPIVYMTTNSNDNVELWGSVSVVPTAGSLDVADASLLALKIV